MNRKLWIHLVTSVATLALLVAAVHRPTPNPWLPNRIPQAAPYNVAEAQGAFPPPYERIWEADHNPGTCGSCHSRVFSEWNGSMMANSWRDPAWRAAFLLSARQVATDGNCDIPQPPDGTPRAEINPFADGECRSTFDLGDGEHTLSRSGSLLDGFCSRCHMPTNYIDNVPLHNILEIDGHEDAFLDPHFDPTSDAGTGLAYATVEERFRNTESGKRGIFCGVCHSLAESRDTPFSNYRRHDEEYVPAPEEGPRAAQVAPAERRVDEVPDPEAPHLGYGIGAGSFRASPHAIGNGVTFGPLAAADSPYAGEVDQYSSQVFGTQMPTESGEFSKHPGFGHAKYPRAEMCAACHDVTNPLTIQNPLGRWVGGFPIERTYTEWLGSRYADRPGNGNYDPNFKRDCQSCHMQQDYGQPGTAQTLYEDGEPVEPLRDRPADSGPVREVYFSHHFIGGNAYVPRLIGADVNEGGQVEDYPELSVFSFSSTDPDSPYYNAHWVNTEATGAETQHARLAWDRLRNVLELEIEAPERAEAGGQVPLTIRVTNSGSGHNFPSGFPEGRVAWVALRAFDLASGEELAIHDAHWNRTSKGVGYLTRKKGEDPNFPDCESWKLPAGSPDPYAHQLKAIASKGDGCPTLDLVYAAPLNLVTDEEGLPLDADGEVIARHNPAPPQFVDVDGDGDLYDDAFLSDTRLRPLPHDDATAELDRYSVIVPEGTAGPVAVTAAVYYQSLEGIVAQKFLGNLADTDGDHVLEPCVLGGRCDGRTPTVEPPAVEGAPPVPMEVASWRLEVDGTEDRRPPEVLPYPSANTRRAYRDVVVKATFTEPVTGVDEESFTLVDDSGLSVPAFVDQIGDGTWGLFPHQVFLEPGATYTARLSTAVCDWSENCLPEPVTWSFRVRGEGEQATGSTAIPLGFPGYLPAPPDARPSLERAEVDEDGHLRLVFSEPVMNVTPRTVRVLDGACGASGSPLDGRLVPAPDDGDGTAWLFEPAGGATPRCVEVTTGVYDLAGQGLAEPTRASL